MKYLNVAQQGHTLIEMMLVLALTALLMLASAQAWWHYRHQTQLEQSARQVADFLQRLQNRAAWGNYHYRIKVSPGVDWSMEVETPGGGASRPTMQAAACPGTIRLDISAPGYLTFAGVRGTATPAHLMLSNQAGRIKIIVSGKGRIRICGEKGRLAGIDPC